jgi:hypothetical protein
MMGQAVASSGLQISAHLNQEDWKWKVDSPFFAAQCVDSGQVPDDRFNQTSLYEYSDRLSRVAVTP